VSKRDPIVLLIDDDDTFRTVLSRELTRAGFVMDTLPDGAGIEGALQKRSYDVVVLDLRMPGLDGMTTLERIKTIRPLTEVVILTGHGSLESAVQALKHGAYDFLAKPCDLDHLESTIRRAAETRLMRSENAALRQELNRHRDRDDLIGTSAEMRNVREMVEKVAATNSTVLIQGESGTGKEIVARAIQRASSRRDSPFVVLDCCATQDALALSELFGHRRGAFTGAINHKMGLFEHADSGTILIDEIGDASLLLQTHLLRVLETGAFRPVGSEESIVVDVRVLAATHRNLEAVVGDGTFREDLYYRLNVVKIEVPPLRQRSQDIPEFVECFLARLNPLAIPTVSRKAMDMLMGHCWPGNVRELKNVLERALILSEGGMIQPEHLPGSLSREGRRTEMGIDEPPMSIQEIERRYLQELLERYGGSRSRVAEVLGISERTVYRKLHQGPSPDSRQ